ncbi:MAG TPA: hypothetical protein VM686_30230 [Polyangiaceae bacterium]|jgi:hypothetical protein|nr:hypothetical protein [Polyangiaceae bacterium]
MATETGEAQDLPEKPRAKSVEARERSERGDRPRRKRKRPKKPVFKSEGEINVPDKQTLGMLGVMVLMTLFLWGFAKAACNAHPPRETRRPRVVKTEELTRDPKSTAVELFQRLGTANFTGAAELVNATGTPEVERQRQSCESNAAACANRRKNPPNVVSTGALLEREPSAATVRVESNDTGAKQSYIVRVEREGATWKVSSWAPDTGQFKPKPASSAMPFSITTRPALSAAPSAPPPASSK